MRRLIAMLLFAGCLSSPATPCGDRLCPPNTVCREDIHYCARPDQIEACNGLADGTACPNGTCTSGVCVEAVCGDGVVNGLEACDGDDLDGKDCSSAGGYYGGHLACKADCTFDFTDCATFGKCGDGTLNTGQELCDGGDLNGKTCLDFGFYQPDGLTCSGACTFDVRACTQRCGDRIVNGPEQCDGSPPVANACSLAGHDAGQLGCSATCADSAVHCADFGWKVQLTGVQTTGLWGIGDTFFSTGLVPGGGVRPILRSDRGGAWYALPGSNATLFYGIWGTAVDDVFAVGTALSIYHYDGATWAPMMVPTISPAPSLRGIAGTGPKDVWVVGDAGTTLHWDGTAWTQVASPTTNELDSVWAASPNDVWAVGRGGTLLHYTGSWQIVPSGTTQALVGIWGRAANDVYAVALQGVMHYDGASWTTLGPACPGVFPHAIGGIANSSEVFIVGEDLNAHGISCQLAAGSWFTVAANVPEPFVAIAGADGGVVAGTNFGGVGYIARGSGANWVNPGIPDPPTIVGGGGVTWARSYVHTLSDIFLVGFDPDGGYATHWNGSSWSTPTLFVDQLDGISGVGASPVVAVGTNGAIQRWNGTAWTKLTSGTTFRLVGVDMADANTAFAVGDVGTIIRCIGTSCQPMASSSSKNLLGVRALSATDVYAVGAGVILHYDGATWSQVTAPGVALGGSSVWARSSTDVWVAGAGTVLHYDGARWRATAADRNLTGVVGSTTDLITSEDQWAGGRWMPMSLPSVEWFVNDMHALGDLILVQGTFDAPAQTFRAYIGGAFRYVAKETVCDDFWDDDNDLLVDCADPDCAGAAACQNGGVCAAATPLACGDTVVGSTLVGASNWPSYGCSGKDETGPEAYYRFVSPTATTVTIKLTGFTGDLDLIVGGASSDGACIPDASCVAASQSFSATETVSLNAAANTPHFVIVDGSAGSGSTFTLSVTCP